RVEGIRGEDGAFDTYAMDAHNEPRIYESKKVILSMGYYDVPNMLNVPGEDLPKVIHYYKEAHPYYNHDVVVVGAKNSAAIAALELWWTGARVTLVHRGPGMHQNVKYWIKPDIENRIKNGEITAYFNSTVKEIWPAAVVLETANREVTLKNDFVLALTGYHPDLDFLRSVGVQIGELPDCKPSVNPETLETNVPGIY